jgi:hypothetical protein
MLRFLAKTPAYREKEKGQAPRPGLVLLWHKAFVQLIAIYSSKGT